MTKKLIKKAGQMGPAKEGCKPKKSVICTTLFQLPPQPLHVDKQFKQFEVNICRFRPVSYSLTFISKS